MPTASGPGGREFSYTFVNVFGVVADADGWSDDPSGLSLGGAIALNDNVHVFGSYSDLSGEVLGIGVDITGYAIGLGFNQRIRENLDGVLRVSALGTEADVPSLGLNGDDTGLGLEGSLRYWAGEQVELNGGVLLTTWDELDSQTILGFGVLFYLSPHIAIGGGAALADDVNMFSFGLRLLK